MGVLSPSFLLGCPPLCGASFKLGRQADPLQIAPDRGGVGPRGDEAQPSTAGGADGDVEGKDARQ